MNRIYAMLTQRTVVGTLTDLSGRPELCRRINGQALRVIILIIMVVTLNWVDLLFTLLAHEAGLLREMNPIAADMLHMDQQDSVVLFKILTVFIGCAMLWRLRRSPWCTGGCWVLVIVYTGLGALWFLWSQDFTMIMELRASMTQVVMSNGVIHTRAGL